MAKSSSSWCRPDQCPARPVHRGGLALAEHLVDGGYVTPGTIHGARTDRGIDLIGPVRLAPTSHAHPRFNKEDFIPNW
ncbi:hypothetical protein GCM10010441_40030 [Kitasatospora paracochleata]|uniref:Uncharacterized protein n=1 Tax=Kitasatospora paracochleata TaxID=58354 RepID=A0ABT1IVV8_9ACTN|nr:hypothetical protein [Kitasatospora paracochleata]MCP2309278.1 hypothetical protein [Kitasatospora paracochleata]